MDSWTSKFCIYDRKWKATQYVLDDYCEINTYFIEIIMCKCEYKNKNKNKIRKSRIKLYARTEKSLRSLKCVIIWRKKCIYYNGKCGLWSKVSGWTKNNREEERKNNDQLNFEIRFMQIRYSFGELNDFGSMVIWKSFEQIYPLSMHRYTIRTELWSRSLLEYSQLCKYTIY